MRFLHSVTNNSNNSYDISDLVWLNQNSKVKFMVAHPVRQSTPPVHHLSCDPKHASSHFPRSSICSDVSLLEWKDCLVKLQPTLEFAFYFVQIHFYRTPSVIGIYILDYIFVVFSPGLLVYDEETVHSLQLDDPHVGQSFNLREV